MFHTNFSVIILLKFRRTLLQSLELHAHTHRHTFASFTRQQSVAPSPLLLFSPHLTDTPPIVLLKVRQYARTLRVRRQTRYLFRSSAPLKPSVFCGVLHTMRSRQDIAGRSIRRKTRKQKHHTEHKFVCTVHKTFFSARYYVECTHVSLIDALACRSQLLFFLDDRKIFSPLTHQKLPAQVRTSREVKPFLDFHFNHYKLIAGLTFCTFSLSPQRSRVLTTYSRSLNKFPRPKARTKRLNENALSVHSSYTGHIYFNFHFSSTQSTASS